MRRLTTTLMLGFALTGLALADTVYLKNGVEMHGTATKQGNSVIVQIGDRQIRYDSTEVERIETNDQTGVLDPKKAREETERQETQLYSETGLTAKDRDEVKALLARLQSTDRGVSAEAHQALVAKGKQVNLMKYLESLLPPLSPRLKPGVLSLMYDLDPTRTKPLLNTYAEDPSYVIRARVLELLGKNGDARSVNLVARGLLDHSVDVRVSAAGAVAALKAKQVTPILLENLKHADMRVRYACNEALSKIWSTETETVSFPAPAQWEQWWKNHSKLIKDPVATDSLTPLAERSKEWHDE